MSGRRSRMTGAPDGVCSLVYSLPPQPETQLPPGSRRELPQQNDEVTSGSEMLSSSGAVLAPRSSR